MTSGPKKAVYFDCIDAHTCGNPVRLVTSGGPRLDGNSMAGRRADFLAHHDWVRTSLLFEPRGHALMSGSILYPSTREDCDIGVLFIETSGCLPMCGHGAIGTVTIAIEKQLVTPRTPGLLALDTPAGRVEAFYTMDGPRVASVRLHNVASFLYRSDLVVECPELGGSLCVDVAYGGNFYAIIEPQEIYADLKEITAQQLLSISPVIRQRLNEQYRFDHPLDERIKGLSHVLWTGAPQTSGAHARNAVFYGDQAIDRSPCGTGTSARMAQLAARGTLGTGDEFIHESIIGSCFRGRVEKTTEVAGLPAIIPSIEGWARIHGENRISVDPEDPFWEGFLVS